MTEFRRILIPTDFSECADHAVEFVSGLAWAKSAEIILLHVVEPVAYPMHQVIGALDYKELDNQVHATSKATLDKTAKKLSGWPGGVRTVVRDGNAAAEIAACVEDEGVDLIVIATHGRTGVRHLILGSSTEAVIRAAKCAVLTVR